jgi:hypothetical protein
VIAALVHSQHLECGKYVSVMSWIKSGALSEFSKASQHLPSLLPLSPCLPTSHHLYWLECTSLTPPLGFCCFFYPGILFTQVAAWWALLLLSRSITLTFPIHHCLFLETVSCYIAQIDLEFLILLLPLPEYWNGRCAPPYLGPWSSF